MPPPERCATPGVPSRSDCRIAVLARRGAIARLRGAPASCWGGHEHERRRCSGGPASWARCAVGWTKARGGHGRLVLCIGEAGIGKTRLCQELAGLADGERLAWGRCPDTDGAPAFWPWREVLRSLGATEPSLGAVESPQDRFRAVDAVAGTVLGAVARRPLVVVLDDVHWADEPSLLVLRHLADRAPDAPLLLVAALREPEPGTAAARALAGLERAPAGEGLHLRGLARRTSATARRPRRDRCRCRRGARRHRRQPVLRAGGRPRRRRRDVEAGVGIAIGARRRRRPGRAARAGRAPAGRGGRGGRPPIPAGGCGRDAGSRCAGLPHRRRRGGRLGPARAGRRR